MIDHWKPTTTPPALGSNCLHIWCVNVTKHEGQHAYYFDFLNTEEKARIDRFYFKANKLAFTLAWGILRELLGHYLGCPPKKIIFSRNKHGKPFLNDHPLEFNISHARSKILMAFHPSRAVGIDIEYPKRDINILGIAERLFTPKEYAYLKSLQGIEQKQAFFRCWTRKEALLKAIGVGLSDHQPRHLASTLPSGEISSTVVDNNNALWHLQDLPEIDKYYAAWCIKATKNQESILRILLELAK